MSDWFSSPAPLIIAHRGASADAPENTITAFALAAEQGADGVELDVQLSADGVPVVIHDGRVDRTTNGTGAVSELTVERLQALDAGDGRPVPTLEQVFEIFGPSFLYNVEIKSGIWPDSNLAAAVAERIEGHHLEDRVLVSSFNFLAVRQARRLLSSRTAVALIRMGGFSAVGHAFVASAADHPHYSLVNERYMAWAARKKLAVTVWTVDDGREAERLAGLGVQGIITNKPEFIRSVLG
jgi:glycerophosphoryl diester phosphodiesterase